MEIPECFASPDVAGELDVEALGGFPEDLVEVVTELGMAGPGTCLLRSLRRATGSARGFADQEPWDAAFGAVDWFRSLFNRSEIASAVRVSATDERHWRAALTPPAAAMLRRRCCGGSRAARQPRQEDLAHYLSEDSADTDVLRIDLSPPARS